MDDARLVVLNARDAADHGADIRTRTEVQRLTREGDVWRIMTSNGTFSARTAVNATGPSVSSLLAQTGMTGALKIRLVRGSHIVVPRLFDHDFAYFFQLPDGRIFFAIPYEQRFTLIGTTDQDHTGPLEHVVASPEEILYLCEGANRYFNKQISADDVIWSYAGVRPLVDDGSGKPEAATRGYHLEMDTGGENGPPLLSIFGGKITTYRHLALAAVSKLQPFLPVLDGPEWTAGAKLPGGDLRPGGRDAFAAALLLEYPFLQHDLAQRLARTYGTAARMWLGEAGCFDDLGFHFGEGLTQAEVEYLVEKEWVRHSDDILWRRTKLGLAFDAAQAASLANYLECRP